MRAESKGVRAGSEAMHSDTRARKQATSTVEHVQVYRAQTGKSPSRGVVQERLRGKVAVLHGSKATVIAACARRMAARKYVKQLREFLHAAIAKQGEHVRSARASEPERQFSMSMSTSIMSMMSMPTAWSTRCHQGSSEAIRGHQRPSEATKGHQGPSGAIRGHQRPSGIRGHQGPSEAIRGHQRPSEAIGPQFSMSMSTSIMSMMSMPNAWSTRCHQGSSGAIRGHQRPSEAIRGHQRPSQRPSKAYQRPPGARGHQRPSGAIRGHQRPSEAIRGHQRPSEAIGPPAEHDEHAEHAENTEPDGQAEHDEHERPPF